MTQTANSTDKLTGKLLNTATSLSIVIIVEGAIHLGGNVTCVVVLKICSPECSLFTKTRILDHRDHNRMISVETQGSVVCGVIIISESFAMIVGDPNLSCGIGSVGGIRFCYEVAGIVRRLDQIAKIKGDIRSLKRSISWGVFVATRINDHLR
jgi:hypothetical protein